MGDDIYDAADRGSEQHDVRHISNRFYFLEVWSGSSKEPCLDVVDIEYEHNEKENRKAWINSPI